MTKAPQNVENIPGSVIDESPATHAWIKPEVAKLDLETAQQTVGIPG
jgi:hypothetical protein